MTGFGIRTFQLAIGALALTVAGWAGAQAADTAARASAPEAAAAKPAPKAQKHHQHKKRNYASPAEREAAAVKEEPATRFAKDQLKAIIERIERLEEEKKTISDDIRDVYAEAKGNGFDVKALRTIVRMRKQDANERAEQETILETYLQALGML